jgi:FkbM family methyltransferase
MEPTLVSYPPPAPPTGHWLTRGLKAVFVDRKVPYRLARWGNGLLKAVGLRHRTVTADGLRFHVRRGTWADEAVIRHVVGDREYHPPGYEIGADDVVVDVGANIGAFAVTASRAAANGRVFAFEPEPENFALLCDNVDRNGCHNVTPVRAAVADTTGEVALSLSEGNSSGHSLRRDHGGDGVVVPAVALGRLLEEYRIDRCDFLKLDCEGAEYEILYGLPKEYFPRIRRVALEYHANPDEKRGKGDELVAFLRGVGFRVDLYTSVVGSRNGLVFASRSTDPVTPRMPR